MRLFSATVLLLGACDQIKLGGGAGGPADQTNIEYYSIPPLPPGQAAVTPTEMMQAQFGSTTDLVVVFYDNSRACEHYAIIAESELVVYRGARKQPELMTCANEAPGASTSHDGSFPTGTAGAISYPMVDNTWSGSSTGGCGTWATAVCNRILGMTPMDSPVTKDEWNMIATGINQDAGGGSNIDNRSKYYKDKGYCAHSKKFNGDAADYTELSRKQSEHCDLKLSFWKKTNTGEFVNGHVETITSVDREGKSMTTNSWGKQATITGGTNHFDHSRDGAVDGNRLPFSEPDGRKLWPADQTEVWIEEACPCNSYGEAAAFLSTATL